MLRRAQKISPTTGNFAGPLKAGDGFGSGSVPIGDLDGDGIMEIAVGARYSPYVFILFLNANGTAKSYNTISAAFGIPFDPMGLVGYGLAQLGDVNGDGVPDLGIGGHRSDWNFTDSGVVFIVFLNANGSVNGFTSITAGFANFNDNTARLFGIGLAGIGDYRW